MSPLKPHAYFCDPAFHIKVTRLFKFPSKTRTGQTTCNLITALCVASRGKNRMRMNPMNQLWSILYFAVHGRMGQEFCRGVRLAGHCGSVLKRFSKSLTTVVKVIIRRESIGSSTREWLIAAVQPFVRSFIENCWLFLGIIWISSPHWGSEGKPREVWSEVTILRSKFPRIHVDCAQHNLLHLHYWLQRCMCSSFYLNHR